MRREYLVAYQDELIDLLQYKLKVSLCRPGSHPPGLHFNLPVFHTIRNRGRIAKSHAIHRCLSNHCTRNIHAPRNASIWKTLLLFAATTAVKRHNLVQASKHNRWHRPHPLPRSPLTATVARKTATLVSTYITLPLTTLHTDEASPSKHARSHSAYPPSTSSSLKPSPTSQEAQNERNTTSPAKARSKTPGTAQPAPRFATGLQSYATASAIPNTHPHHLPQGRRYPGIQRRRHGGGSPVIGWNTTLLYGTSEVTTVRTAVFSQNLLYIGWVRGCQADEDSSSGLCRVW